jgi:hypothetical protein
MILHIPHASRVIPADVRRTLLLTDAELELELSLMTDAFTDELFLPAAGDGDAAVVFPVSRLVVDPERFEDDALEPMASVGMGAVYVKTSHGAPLRAKLPGRERETLLGLPCRALDHDRGPARPLHGRAQRRAPSPATVSTTSGWTRSGGAYVDAVRGEDSRLGSTLRCQSRPRDPCRPAARG